MRGTTTPPAEEQAPAFRDKMPDNITEKPGTNIVT